MFSAYIFARVVVNPALAPTLPPTAERRSKLIDILHVLPISVLLIIVLGAIYAGLATPTKSAVLGVVGALILVRMYGQITFEAMQTAVMSSIRTTCMVMLIVISAQVLSAALTYSGISRGLSETIFNLGLPKSGFFAALVLLYIVLGCFVEGIAMIYITLPILYPVIRKFGFDPIWFGVVLVVLIEVGQIHPPLAINLFTIQSIARGEKLQRDRVRLPAIRGHHSLDGADPRHIPWSRYLAAVLHVATLDPFSRMLKETRYA